MQVRQLKQFFECHGQVLDHVVMMARSTKRSRGFGFVTFAREVSYFYIGMACSNLQLRVSMFSPTDDVSR